LKKKLAISIREIYDMFMDFSLLVQEQHEKIISIDILVESANEHVNAGNNQLRTAIEHQRKIRKKKLLYFALYYNCADKLLSNKKLRENLLYKKY